MQLAPSTNKHDFMAFLHNVKQAVLPRYRSQQQVVVYDGAKAHTCKDSQQFMVGYFTPLQIPPYSCEFNCKFCYQSESLSRISHNIYQSIYIISISKDIDCWVSSSRQSLFGRPPKGGSHTLPRSS